MIGIGENEEFDVITRGKLLDERAKEERPALPLLPLSHDDEGEGKEEERRREVAGKGRRKTERDESIKRKAGNPDVHSAHEIATKKKMERGREDKKAGSGGYRDEGMRQGREDK